MPAYRPRSQSARFRDGDCPTHVLAIYDNRGATADRYTVIYRDITRDPVHPLGIGMYFENQAGDIAAYRYRIRRHACRWTDLPEAVRECVRQDATAA